MKGRSNEGTKGRSNEGTKGRSNEGTKGLRDKPGSWPCSSNFLFFPIVIFYFFL